MTLEEFEKEFDDLLHRADQELTNDEFADFSVYVDEAVDENFTDENEDEEDL